MIITLENEKQQDLSLELLSGNPDTVLNNLKPFAELMMYYRCTLHEVETKLKVLSNEFNIMYNRNPIESIKTRVKAPMSIVGKLKRKGFPMTLESIENNLFDIAGVRVICSFQDDIYKLAEILARQDDIAVIEIKDYIENPKPNGYRSLHMIIEMPIFLSKGKRPMKAEIQFRTIAMDFWASLEHTLKYKNQIENPENIAFRLKACAEIINGVDVEMQDIRKLIDDLEILGDDNEQK